MRVILKNQLISSLQDNLAFKVDLCKKINWELSDECCVDDGKVIFLMKRKESLINELWYALPTGEDITGGEQLELKIIQANEYAKSELKQMYESVCLFYECGREILKNEVLHIKRVEDIIDVNSLKVNLVSSDFNNAIKSNFNRGLEKNITSVDERWVSFDLCNKANNFIVESKQENEEAKAYRKWDNVDEAYILFSEGIYFINGKYQYIGKPKKNASHVTISAKGLKKENTKAIKFNKNIITIGENKGMIYFDEIEIPDSSSNIKVVAVTKGNVILEWYNEMKNNWVKMVESEKSDMKVKKIRFRAIMETGAVIKQLTVYSVL